MATWSVSTVLVLAYIMSLVFDNDVQKTSSNGIDGSDSAVLAGEVHKRHDVVQEDLPDGGRGDRGGEGDAGEVAED